MFTSKYVGRLLRSSVHICMELNTALFQECLLYVLLCVNGQLAITLLFVSPILLLMHTVEPAM